MLAAIKGLEGKTIEALAVVQSVIDQSPSQPQGYVRMAQILARMGNRQGAQDALARGRSRGARFEGRDAAALAELGLSP
jgi:predicted Zn-dependent protease